MESNDKVEILGAIHALTNKVQAIDDRLGTFDEKFHTLDDKLDTLDEKLSGLATHMDKRFDQVYATMATKDDLANEVGKIRADMATKDFVERRITASEDRMVAEIQKVDAKVGTLTDILERKNVITSDEADIVTA